MTGKFGIALLLVGLALGNTAIAGTARSQDEKQQGPTTQTREKQKLAAGEAMAKQLLLLMDTDKNGKVSKQEWMKFMEEEFERLDVNKDGELDVKELTRSKVRSSQSFTAVGK